MRDGWTEKTLGDILTLLTDGSHFSPETVSQGFPYVTVRDVRDGNIDFAGSARISQSAFEELVKSGCSPKVGDVLFSKDGTVGRVAQVKTELPFVVLSSLAILRPNQDVVSSDFLAVVLSGDDFQGRATGSKTGLAIKRVVLKTLRTLSILLPPISEQKRIVDLVAAVDEYIAALQRHADVARTARNAVLHELLTAGGDDWVETALGDVAEVLDRMRKPISGAERATRQGQVPYYGATGQTGWIDTPLFDEELVLLGEDAIDFLNPAVHKAYLISGPSWVNNHAHVLRARKERILSFFLMESLNSVDYSKFIAFGTRSKLTQGAMMGITVNLPPLREQNRIVGIVSSMDDVIRATESAIVESKNLRSGLLSDLLSGQHEIPASYDRLLGAA